MANEIKTLGEALPEEINRVLEIIKIYESLEKGAGLPAAALMKIDIQKAYKSMIENDLARMIEVYKDLKEWKL